MNENLRKKKGGFFVLPDFLFLVHDNKIWILGFLEQNGFEF